MVLILQKFFAYVEIGSLRGNAIVARRRFLRFERLLGSIYLSAVIPGCAGGAGPESIATIWSMDSGLDASRAPE
jgi:hypothetical protein